MRKNFSSFVKVQDAHLEGRTPISKIQDVTEIRFKRKFGWASEERKTQRFVREGFRRTKTQRFTIGWASVFRRTGKFQDSFGRSGGLPCSEEREISKDSIWWASEERKTKKPRFVRSGGLPKNENPKIRSGGLPKNENPKIRSGGLPKNENPKIKIRSGGLLCGKTKIRKIGWSGLPTFGKRRTKIRSGGLLTFGKRGTKIRSGGVGFRPSGKEEPRFVSGVSGVF
ncbi:hypothetical protein GLOIN_2v1779851 [Rhizophagus irregularis DAOM 181602=DAOM 197198]|nr:hypothetical protein GLOIN_2v1779851 [Rhizophagus irregularis DAOM 181602=DAOM 197198]